MKKLLIVLTMLMTLCFTACGEDAELQRKKAELEDMNLKITALQTELQELSEMVVEEKVAAGVEKYIVTFEIKQSHMLWDIENNIKDSMNAISIEVMVDKEYYDAVEIGTVINNDFRVGSALMSGSYGSWDIKIKNKEIR